MNTKQLYITTMLLLTGSGPALAAAGPSEEVMGIAGWVFCGYCALIIVAQTLRALRQLLRLSQVRKTECAVEKVRS